MKQTYWIIVVFLICGATIQAVWAAESLLGETLKTEIQRRYPSAKIELGATELGPLTYSSPIKRVQLIKEAGLGRAEFLIESKDGAQQITQVKFVAMISTFVAQRRIRPGEKLKKDDFQIQSIDVSQGIAHEYRSLMLAPSTELEKLEARQTILQGQYPLMSGVQKMPDLRRGDTVQVTLVSGKVRLTTQGIAQEPAYFDAPVRILTHKTKKELVGKLLSNGAVEVSL